MSLNRSQIWHKHVGSLGLSSPHPAMEVLGAPHNPVDPDLRRSASSSTCRTRLDRVVNNVCVSPGTSLSNTEKCRRLITSNRIGVAATTVADRGPPSSKLISPKNSPGCRGTCFSADTSTRAVPSMITKNSSPGSPARVSTMSAATSKTWATLAALPSCPSSTPADGTGARAPPGWPGSDGGVNPVTIAAMSLPYDPRRPEVLADPYPVLHHLQDEDPVHWSEILGGWVLTRYDDVKAALGDPRLSSDRITPFVNHYAKGGGGELGELGRLVGLWAVFTDPPTHTRLRGLMNRAFTSRAVEQLRPRIVDIVAELLEAVQPNGRMDVIRDFAYPLPITVIAEMIGVPREDREAFKIWSDELAAFIGSASATPGKYERAARAISAMADYFRRMIPARRANPREDIMSALVAAWERDDPRGEDELVASCILLLFAGHETTTNLIGNGVLALLRHPAQARALRDHADLAGSAVEEILRYDGPTPTMVRVAVEDIELQGRTIRRGDR